MAIKSLLIALVVSTMVASLSMADTKNAKTAIQAVDKFHQGVVKRYPTVEHISTKQLAQMPRESVLLFDVREATEFNVSHLAHAIRVDPDINPGTFLTQHSHKMHGKTIIFYCSLGERSSKLAQAVLDTAAATDVSIVNLEGGLFKWHNEQRTVVDASGVTENIHSYSRFWQRYLVHQTQILNP